MGKLTFALAAATALCACGGGGPSAPDAFNEVTTCGMPGDEGNEMGVGKFCVDLNDCADTPNARLCSNIGDDTTWFCTHTCLMTDPPDVCGTGAECVCGNGGCGCTPSVCLQ